MITPHTIALTHQLCATFDARGFAVMNRYLDHQSIADLIAACDEQNAGSTLSKRGVVFARRNLLDIEKVRQFAGSHPVRELVEPIVSGAIVVRGILFDKAGDANWAVPWHQDRSIAVAEKRESAGYGPWSVKAGVVHVQPPVEVLRRMVTLRFSLDVCGVDNGPLRVIDGTHRSVMSQTQIDAAVAKRRDSVCTTDVGGVVIMRPLLLHASSPATHVGRRRVLHLEFGPPQLPGQLAWAASGL